MTNNTIAMAPTHLTWCPQNVAGTVLLTRTGALGVSVLGDSGHDVRPTLAANVYGAPSYVMADVAAFAGPDRRVRIAKNSRPPRGEPAE